MQRLLGLVHEGKILAVPLTPQLRSAYGLLLLVSGVLLVVFALTLLLVRVLRRYRQTYMASRRKPTPNADVWQQHRLPEDWEKRIEPGEPPKEK
jgi:hypothetical protein